MSLCRLFFNIYINCCDLSFPNMSFEMCINIGNASTKHMKIIFTISHCLIN